jgi:signal transduction histidine kinase
VFRHLAQLARSTPDQLPEVFDERQGTLDSSIAYLENLASNYARLYPRSERRSCDLGELIEKVVTDLRGPEQTFGFRTQLSGGAIVLGDPLSLRRVLENLVDNAIDSLEGQPGEITVSSEVVAGGEDGERVRITVADTGTGMNEEQRAKVFDDFYTTKEKGTGLGLSIVRRLVMDMDGTIGVESEPEKGSRFVVELPAAGSEQGR